MDTETKESFEKVFEQFDNIERNFSDVKTEIKRLDVSIDAIPDKIDGIYGHTINDILDRLATVEEKLGIGTKS